MSYEADLAWANGDVTFEDAMTMEEAMGRRSKRNRNDVVANNGGN